MTKIVQKESTMRVKLGLHVFAISEALLHTPQGDYRNRISIRLLIQKLLMLLALVTS